MRNYKNKKITIVVNPILKIKKQKWQLYGSHKLTTKKGRNS